MIRTSIAARLSFAAAALCAASAAGAVTWFSPTGGADPGKRASETTLVDFDTPASAPSEYAAGLIRTGSTPGVAASPLGDTTPYLSVSSGSFTFDAAALSTAFDQFSFYWGSIDAGNLVEVLDRAGNVLLSLTGAQLPQSNGDWSADATNRRVYFDLGTGETLGAVRFSYVNPAFEIDNLAFGTATGIVAETALPEPSTWALLVTGFAMIGVAARRRSRPLAA